jgi:hypothetical protein
MKGRGEKGTGLKAIEYWLWAPSLHEEALLYKITVENLLEIEFPLSLPLSLSLSLSYSFIRDK